MQVIIKGSTDKPCVVCGKSDARKVVVREEDFQGPLCRDHVWAKSGDKKEPANGTGERPKATNGSSSQA